MSGLLDELTERVVDDWLSKKENAVRGMVGMTFRGTVSVEVHRPRWMPERMYRWLMRTIVIVERRA